ncbi:ribonuclease [Streptomyces diastaticus subsp. diastaticus]|uniref:Ribonuclease n=1 Tax=Streptomyces diastaticus subsp. diastaticus TaxID=68040 RepID=A0ABQ1CHA4_STRDI|nr:YihY/virulence factor BrkB family protein [Streptomyces diastaticus]GFH69777.1 ribonuclease [Streptomyces diastaticus subsp. diastaticus]GGU19600.1 ribonuclease [Streptomyces diastaticus subsp. diastaticus]
MEHPPRAAGAAVAEDGRPAKTEAGRPAEGTGPRRPAGWWQALRRTPGAFWRDDVSDYAAALTYYAILAVLPALLVVVIGFGLVSPDTAERFVAQVTAWAPGDSGAPLRDVLTRVVRVDSTAWTLLVTGGASALWSASSYLAVSRRALHRMHGVPDRRSPWQKAHRIVATALALLALLVVSSLLLMLTEPVAESFGRLLGLDAGVAWAWSVLRWPLLPCLVACLVVVVFRNGPPAARRRAYSLPGGALAATLWLTASAGLALYASVLSTYSRLYGSLAGIVVFLIWLWLSNVALLLGAQFTAELSRVEREEDPADGDPAAPPPR